MKRIAVLHSTVREEEKLIRRAAVSRGVEVAMIDIRKTVLRRELFPMDWDVALDRSLSSVKGKYVSAFLETMQAAVVNPTPIARICEDKYLTSLRLESRGIPTPPFAMAFTLDQALEAVEMLGGYPVVVKPPLGSWGRLLAKVNDRDALETVLEHKDVLGTPPQKAFYLQRYVPKPGRDIRAFVVGRDVLCAVARESSHWITNTARGGRTRNYPLGEELRDLCRRTSSALGEGLLAVDIFETESGLMVNEVNHNMEFRNSEEPTGVSISGAIVEYCLVWASGSSSRAPDV